MAVPPCVSGEEDRLKYRFGGTPQVAETLGVSCSGRLYVHEILLSDSKDGPLAATSFSRNILLTTDGSSSRPKSWKIFD